MLEENRRFKFCHNFDKFLKQFENVGQINRTACIRHQCRKATTVLSCQRCLINTSVEKINNI